jgi:hypothetical protein
MPMYEEPWFVPAVLGGVVFFQFLLLVAVLRLSGKISALSRQVASASREPAYGPELVHRKEENSEQKKWFAQFLEEEPARRDLPKKEQFAAFRKWREEKGLNWKSAGEA